MEMKFRAECLADVLEVQKLGFRVKSVIQMEEIPDYEVVILSGGKTLLGVMRAIHNIPDSHIMVETINWENKYTGERREIDYPE